jgi:hypothetical protein
MAMSSVLQPFYSKFSHLGTLDFIPNPWNLDRVKINVQLKPDDLAETAIDFMVQKGVYRKEAPIVAMVAEYLLMKAKEDDELSAVFKGVRALPSAPDQLLGVPGTPTGARNGIRKVIRDYVAGGQTATIAMGAVPTDPVLFVTYMEEYRKSIPEKYRGLIKWFSMSSALRERFMSGMDIKYNTNYKQDENLVKIHNTSVEVKGFESHSGSSMIWTSIPENCIGFIKNPSNQTVFALGEKDLYDVQMGTDWYEGYNFINPDWVFQNGQDLA